MLTHLTLINFALADHLALDIEQGFNVLQVRPALVNPYYLMRFLPASVNVPIPTMFVMAQTRPTLLPSSATSQIALKQGGSVRMS